MNSRLLITLLCAGAVALACGSLSRNDVAREESLRRSTSTATTGSASATPKIIGNFAVNIEPHALRFALNVTNSGKKDVELEFPNGQQYEFTVLDSIGREVYRWGMGRMFTQSMQNRSIDVGDALQITEVAETTLPRGKYVAVATLRSTNFPIKQSSQFELR